MPSSGAHITVVEKVAASSAAMQNLLGDPFLDPNSPAGMKMKYSKLGACGPDIFIGLADISKEFPFQDFANFLLKVAGTYQCISELMEKVDRYVSGIESTITFGVSDSLQQSFDLIKATLNQGLLAMIVGPAKVNLFPFLEPARQQDEPRQKWYWIDYLHYIKTGKFTTKLIENAKNSGNEKLIAYAYGYLTHYVTDTVGHPYVNQVVQGPWRLYWQRHHLVENFMDAYVWNRWHVSNPPPPPPTTEEQPLDTFVTVPNISGNGAPVTFSRLNDHINIGGTSIGDPVDSIVTAVCEKIDQGLFSIGASENMDQVAPNDPDFKAWTKLMAGTIKEVYDMSGSNKIPENLMNNILPPRADGYPTEQDIASAYGMFRLLLKIATEDGIKEPQPPDIIGDISDAVDQLIQDLQDNFNSFPPLPSISTSGSFSWDALWDAIKKIAEWIGETLETAGQTIFDFIKDLINIAGTAVSGPIKYALYLLNKLLFSIYSAFRDVLVYAAYSMPFTNKLSVDMGGGHNSSILWQSPGNRPRSQYPVEEIAEERKYFFSDYAPFVPPDQQAASQKDHGLLYLEHPNFSFIAPYEPAPGGPMLTPDVFLDVPLGKDNMFLESGLQQPTQAPIDPVFSNGPPTVDSITIAQKNFGGAVANSILGIQHAEAGFPDSTKFPDYNLDGDRSYAWPCWDVTDRPNPEPITPLNPGTRTPLAPERAKPVDNYLEVDDYSKKEAIVKLSPADS